MKSVAVIFAWRFACWARTLALALLATLPLCSAAWGQATPRRLYEQRPFDRLTVIEGAGTKALNVKPIPFPERRVPTNPKPSDKLRIRLLEDDREFEILWSHVKQVELFEQMVLAEANQVASQGKLDEAFSYFTFLYNFYPDMEGLKQGHAAYLYLSAGQAFKQQKYAEALGVLEELLALDRNYRASDSSPSLMQVLSGIADKLLAQYTARQDYRSVRTLLHRLIRQYKAGSEPFAVKWQTDLAELAAQHRDAAREYLKAEQFVQAYDAVRQMQDVWPEVEGGAELSAEISRRYPLVRVGVSHPALEFNSHSLANPAARRAGRLLERRLMEFVGPGPEGGKYLCPLGAFERSDDGLQLHFALQSSAGQAANGYAVSQHLLDISDRASFDFQPAWARLMEAVRVTNVQQVEVDLRMPHVLPEALLQINYGSRPPSGEPREASNGPYVVFQKAAEATRFTANAAYSLEAPHRPAEIVERLYTDPQRALLALRRGEVDCLDQVFPGDVASLRQETELAVVPYTSPTTHVLIPGRANPYVANRTFRRALVYGSDRETILKQGLLRGGTLAGYRVISAPFPAGVGLGNSVAYGYDEQIEPRPYDASLAFTLRILAEREIKADFERQEKKAPAFEPLVIGHPADEVSRIACRALEKQWKPLGIAAKLLEFPPGQFVDARGECDLIYVQLATWEPIVDAGRLFADEGIVPVATPYFRLTLRKIESARNWQQARSRLQELHRLVHEEVTVIPLWQTLDHYAFRRNVQGLETERVTLYQDVEQWQTTSRLAGKGL